MNNSLPNDGSQTLKRHLLSPYKARQFLNCHTRNAATTSTSSLSIHIHAQLVTRPPFLASISFSATP